jgi:tetratricopeptide (TPR) repeat protein
MPDLIKNLEKLASLYFEAGDMSKYHKLLAGSAINAKVTAGVSETKQLQHPMSVPDKYQAAIDILITFAKGKLPKTKFYQLIFHVGDRSIYLGELSASLKIFNFIISEIKDEENLQHVAAQAYLALGDLYSRQAKWKESIKNIKLASKIFKKYKDLKGIARCENLIGTIQGEKGEIKKAKAHFEKSISELDHKKDNVLMGMMDINLGVLNTIQGNYDVALTCYQRSLVTFEQLEDTRRLVEIRHNLGMLYTQKGEYKEALAEFDQSIFLAIKMNYLPSISMSYQSKAYIYTRLHDYPLASAFADRAMEMCDRLNDRLSIADIYKIKGIIERNQGNFKSAENYLLSSLRINQELENSLNEAETNFELGLLYFEINNEKQAHQALLSALKYYKKSGVTETVKRIEALLFFSN